MFDVLKRIEIFINNYSEEFRMPYWPGIPCYRVQVYTCLRWTVLVERAREEIFSMYIYCKHNTWTYITLHSKCKQNLSRRTHVRSANSLVSLMTHKQSVRF